MSAKYLPRPIAVLQELFTNRQAHLQVQNPHWVDLLHAWSIDLNRPHAALGHPLRFHSQRRRLLHALAAGPTALALAACGGGNGGGGGIDTGPGASPVIDRRVPVAPGVSLEVRDWPATGGGPGAPAIVLLAGLGANAHGFDSLAPALATGARVVAVSRRGYGRSDKPLPVTSATQHYEVDTLVSDLKALLDGLGLPRVVLAGHSIAGNELTGFAGRFPQQVQGLVYLDTTFDYSKDADAGGEEPPHNAALNEPGPTALDTRSLQAVIAFERRLFKNWWPALEANLRHAIDLLPDGSVRFNTPADVAVAMDVASHKFSPDYSTVRAPALVVTTLPADHRDVFPWLDAPFGARTAQDIVDVLRIFRRVRVNDGNKLAAALNTPHHLTLDHCCHGDFLIEREADVVRAIQAMAWA